LGKAKGALTLRLTGNGRLRWGFRPIVLGVGAAVALVVGAAAMDAVVHRDTIHTGVRAGGVPLGGMTRTAAEGVLRREAEHRLEGRVKLLREAESWTLTLRDLGVSYDVQATARDAVGVGREANPLVAVLKRLRALFVPIRLPWVVDLDDAKFRAGLAKPTAALEVVAAEPKIVVRDNRVEVVPGRSGRMIDRAALAKGVRALAAESSRSAVAIPLTDARPTVSDEVAAVARARAETLLGAPSTVVYEGRELVLDRPVLSTLLQSRVVDAKLDLVLAEEALHARLVGAFPGVEVPAVEAGFATDGPRATVRPSSPGAEIDTPATSRALLDMPSGRRVELAVKTIQPKLTTEDASKLGIKERVVTYTTTFDARNAPRVHNIDLIAHAIDGTIVRPGGVFSMNEATGPRTAEKGYRTAQVVVNGELVPGIGGGTCQAGTTVFNAALLAGYEIVDRTNHQLYISHYPLGRDATLNYPDTDLKFRNDTQYGVYLRAIPTSRSLTVELYSTDLGTEVTFNVSARYNIVQPPTRYISDPNLAEGQEKVEESGSAGFDVRVEKVVKRQGVEVRKSSFRSHYVPFRRIVRRGTGPGSTTTTPAPTPSSTPTPAPTPSSTPTPAPSSGPAVAAAGSQTADDGRP